jgi:hypothetical protein
VFEDSLERRTWSRFLGMGPIVLCTGHRIGERLFPLVGPANRSGGRMLRFRVYRRDSWGR